MRFKPITPYERDVVYWYRNMSAAAVRVRDLAKEAGHFLCEAYIGRGPPRKPGKHKIGVLWRHGKHRNYQFLNLGEAFLFPTPILTTCPTVCLVGANYPEFRLTSATTNYHVLEVNRRTAIGYNCVPALAVQCTPDEAMGVAVHLFDWMTDHPYGYGAVPFESPVPGELNEGLSVPQFVTNRAAHAVSRWRRQAATIDLQASVARSL